ncbi:MAG TPA: TraM recognition domain-containing protein [Gemmataceae bacterium]|nr:TraM recognition domain-containing protein [Gemmataceae bacterium]
MSQAWQWPPGSGLFVVLLILLLLLFGALRVRGHQAANPPAEPPLLLLNDFDAITVHQMYEGCLGIGGTGSGKSSTLQHLMLALMQRGAGMLFLTAKGDDYAAIARLAAEAGRAADLVRFAPGEQWRFDFLNYELTSPGGSVQTAGQLMQDLVDFSTRTSAMQNNEPFWPIAAARKIRMAMTVVFKAKGKCGIDDIYNFCVSMPNTPEQRDSKEFRESFCCECLLEASQKCPDDDDLGLAGDFVLKEWPRLSDRTGGCIDAYVNNLTEKYMHGSVRDLVANGTTNVSPAGLDAGKLIVVDLPVLVGREPYQFVQMIWKLGTLRHALRRTITPESRDLVIWADEAQLHALPSVDSAMQAVSRSQKLINVAITQNIPLLESVLKRREDVLAWISNLQTKFIFANSDKDTNEYFSALLGQSKQLLGSGSVNTGNADPLSDWFGIQQQGSYSMTEHFLPQVRPEAWTRCRKGGRENGYMVDCYVFQGGRRFSNGKTWIKTSFRQRV